jgi:hypothetical protein
MKILKKSLISLLIVLAISQFFGPEKNDGDMATVAAFLAETNPPEDVKQILETTCFDCHSSKSTYPWYNSITPINYWLEEHIKDGKKHLNFSKWNTYSLKNKAHKMDELYEEVEEGEMPLNSYTWTHSEANLTPAQIVAVVTWGKKVQADYKQQIIAK